MLTACGGGGGDNNHYQPSPTPTCTLPAISTANGCVIPTVATLAASPTTVLYGAKATLMWGYTGGTPTSCVSSGNWNLGGNAIGSGLSEALTSNTTFAYTCSNAAGSIVANTTVTVCAQGQVISSGVCTTPTVSCISPVVLNSILNSCEYPMGMWVTIGNQLPVGCTSWTQSCWANSTEVKWVESSAPMIGLNTRPVRFAFFRNATVFGGINGMWNTIPFYADSKEPVYQDISGGIPQEIDRVYGTSTGLIMHMKASGLCTQQIWHLLSKTWSWDPSVSVICPQ